MYIYCFVIAMAFIVATIIFIKKRALDIKYSFMWLVVGITMAILSLNSSIIESLAAIFNIKYAPALLFLIGIIFCFALIFNLIIIISSLKAKIVRLTQEVGILKSNLRGDEK